MLETNEYFFGVCCDGIRQKYSYHTEAFEQKMLATTYYNDLHQHGAKYRVFGKCRRSDLTHQMHQLLLCQS